MIGALTVVLLFAQNASSDRATASVTFEAGARASALAARIEAVNPDWRKVLPECPCSADEAARDRRTWIESPTACPQPYHPGAARGVRTRSTYSSGPGTRHGQQCCYDATGTLITKGPGAGTPDYWSPRTDVVRHLAYDVQSWWDLGWEAYEEHWTPSAGVACSETAGNRR